MDSASYSWISSRLNPETPHHLAVWTQDKWLHFSRTLFPVKLIGHENGTNHIKLPGTLNEFIHIKNLAEPQLTRRRVINTLLQVKKLDKENADGAEAGRAWSRSLRQIHVFKSLPSIPHYIQSKSILLFLLGQINLPADGLYTAECTFSLKWATHKAGQKRLDIPFFKAYSF